ncbi:ATP synthase d subunit [Rhizophlyctis rosea]|uniref:ATP synthase subunit d, mitochondrial n=1 Tax=Rhizophlyctis rosea TaxID=64517 RepID=A0AAD5X6H9_9FUNG|nr:ATP synthase d subunit [Rhizophlyctis rosea]
MATQVRSAAQRIDWAGVASKLRPETASAINAFRRRHQELAKTVADLREAETTVNFEQYRKVLKNAKVITEAEAALKRFTPATVDLSQQLRIIEEQEKKAIAAAETTRQQVAGELGELQQMLKNIETARPVDQLTVDDVCNAVPNQEIDRTVIKMAKRGQWVVPGYYEKFGEFIVGF